MAANNLSFENDPTAMPVGAVLDHQPGLIHNAKRIITALTLTAALSGAAEFMDNSSAEASPTNISTSTVTSNVEITANGFQVSASDVVSDTITFIQDEHISGYKSVKPASCVWESTFWNSGTAADGKKLWFKDHNGEICRDSHSPTGWVKVAGGITGRDCGNEAKPFGPAPGPVTKEFEILPTLNEQVKITATSTVEASEPCGSAEASATSSETVNLEAYLRGGSDQEGVIDGGITATATAAAEAQVTCVPVTPVVIYNPPVTPPAPVTISITQESTAEALYPNSSEQLSVDVSSSNGSVPTVTWLIAKNQGNGEGSVATTGYEDQDGNPDHQDVMFYNGTDVGQTYIIAEATDGNATPVYTEFDIATQQDSGSNF